MTQCSLTVFLHLHFHAVALGCVTSSFRPPIWFFNATLVSCSYFSHLLKINKYILKKYLESHKHRTQHPCLLKRVVQCRANKKNLSQVLLLLAVRPRSTGVHSLVSSFSDSLVNLLIGFYPFFVAFYIAPITPKAFSNAYMISQFCASVRDKE